MLAEVVVDDEHVLALVHEIFAHRAAGIGCDVLQRRQLRRRRGYDDGIVHRAARLEHADQLRNGRPALADGDVDADDVLALLVEDGVGGDGGLAGLAVADDQLTLAAANGDHRVDGLDAGLEWDTDALALENAGRGRLDRVEADGVDRALAVDRLTQRVDDAADERLAHGHGHDAARALDGVALADALFGAKHDDGNGAFLQILRHAVHAAGEFEQLAGHAAVESCRAGNAVADQGDGAGLRLVDLCFVVFDLRTDDAGNLFRS